MAKRRDIVGVTVVAKDCGITTRQIWNLVRDKGLPQVSAGKFDRKAVRGWWEKYKAAGGSDPRLREAEIRLKIVQAEAQELKLAMARGELIPAPLLVKALEQTFTAFGARIEAIPRKAVPRLKTVSGDAAREKLLRDLGREALSELSNFDFARLVGRLDKEPSGGGNGSAATAGPDNIGVGRSVQSSLPRGKRRAGKVEHRQS